MLKRELSNGITKERAQKIKIQRKLVKVVLTREPERFVRRVHSRQSIFTKFILIIYYVRVCMKYDAT